MSNFEIKAQAQYDVLRTYGFFKHANAPVPYTAGAQLLLGDGNTTNAATSLSLSGISYSVG